MFTSTQETLIESSFAGDDVALLALADYYEEEGDPHRAELIRLQAKADGTRVFADLDLEFEAWRSWQEIELVRRQEELLRQHESRWVAHLPHLPGIEYEVVRGLPLAVAEDGHALRCNLGELAKHAEVRAVRLMRVGGVRALARCRDLAHFRSVSLPSTLLGPKTFSVLADCPYLAGLTDLCLEGATLTPDKLSILEKSPHWKGLTRLSK
jgi:uncharacterized protein (TIGR02996 family)